MPRVLVLGLCAGYFLVLLDVTVVNVALPQINSDLQAGQSGMAGVVNAYTIVLAALLLPFGAIGDKWGHRRVVVFGFLCFFVGSLSCSLSPTITLLVASRAIQGAGAAATMAGTLAMLSESAADDRERSKLVGLWAALGGIALPLGPLLGGLLVDVGNWRAVFWLNLPVILLALVPIIVHSSRSTAPGPRDDQLPAAGGVSESSNPSRVRLTIACIIAGLLNFCVLGSLFLLTQNFQDVRGLSPFQAGLATAGAAAAAVLRGTVRNDQQPPRGLGDECAWPHRGRCGPRADGADRLSTEPVGAVDRPCGLGDRCRGPHAGDRGGGDARAAAEAGIRFGSGSTARNVGGAAGVAVFAALHDVETGVLMASGRRRHGCPRSRLCPGAAAQGSVLDRAPHLDEGERSGPTLAITSLGLSPSL